MKLVADVFELTHDLLHQLGVTLALLRLGRGEGYTDDRLFEDVIVEVVFVGHFLPFLEVLLQLEVQSEGARVDLVQGGKEVLAEVLVVFVEALEGEDAGDNEEDIGIAHFHHFAEAVVFFRDALNGAREVQQMALLLAGAEVAGAFLPALLVLHQSLHQVRVVLQLRVHHLDVFVVFTQQSAERAETSTDLFTQDTDGLRLVAGDAAQNAFGL